jgi:hypothetical protein
VTEPLIPSPEELAAELVRMLRTGVTTQQLRHCPAILGLAVTKAKAASESPNDVAVAAHTLLREAAACADDEASGAAALLLGLAPGTRGSLLKHRRDWAAKALHLSVEHVRKEREPLLLEAVADELYAADSAYRLRHRHRTEAERQPERSALGIDWLAQHRSYRRIWTPINAMRNDIIVLLRYLEQARRTGHEDQPAIADRLCNITWHWARFEWELRRFINEQGGLWLLADADSEIAAADALYRIRFHVPLGAVDDSWLRTLLAETPHQELDGFTDRLIAAGDSRREIMAAWIDWARCCSGKLDVPDPRCELHAWNAAAEEFIRLIDEDWYRVADCYRTPQRDVTGLDVRELWESRRP